MENQLANDIKNNVGPSKFLDRKLHGTLKEVEDFYYSEDWERRMKRKLELYRLDPIELSVIQGEISHLAELTNFTMLDKEQSLNGQALGENIYINTNMNQNKVNDAHIRNIVMHEFGHIMYSHIPILEELNSIVIGDPKRHLIKKVSGEDLFYFTNKDELRLRIIPLVKEMYDNDWTLEEVYFNSPNLIQDPIYKLYSKEYIIHLIANII